MKTTRVLAACCAAIAALGSAAVLAQPAHALRQTGGLVLHYGLVPAEMVLAVPRPQAEREMHGAAGRSGSHLVLAIFDAASGQRVSQAEVVTHITLVGGASTTKRLELMTINDLASYGAFVPVGAPGIYKIRFEVKRPGVEGTASAEFEHRVVETRRQGKRR